MIFGRRRSLEEEYAEYYQDVRDPTELPTRNKKQPKPTAIKPHMIVLFFIVVMFLAAVWIFAGRAMWEKTMQALFAPVGLVWIGLFALFYLSVLHRVRGPAIISLLLWLVLTAFGNSAVTHLMIRRLEAPFPAQDIAQLPTFDFVVVLGGSATVTTNDRPQFTSSGDRLRKAAAVYHAEKAERLICSGTHSLPPSKGQLTQAEIAYRLLRQLDVPTDSILQIGGRNTLEEMQALDRFLDARNRTELRIGVITSAWHMQRAMRLAETVGVDAIPIPANHQAGPLRRTPHIIIPSAGNLELSRLALKEYVAGWFGR